MDKPTERQAIALKYDGENAPNLTAKGNDELAEEILQIAREHNVPIYENADLVRLLARLGWAMPFQKPCIKQSLKLLPLLGT